MAHIGPKHVVVRTLIVIIEANIVVFDYAYYYTKLLTIVLNTTGLTHIRITSLPIFEI